MKRRPILVLLAISAGVCPLRAQVPATADPGAIQKSSQDTFQYYELQKKLDDLQRQDAAENAHKSAKTAPDASAAKHTTFLLNHLEISPSELLSLKELSGIAVKYEGHEVSIADLSKVVDEINHLYESKHYPTAHAMLPAQQIANGVVKIMLIEGRVGKVTVAHAPHTRDSFILNSVHLQSGELLRVDKLQQDISFLNHTSDLNVKAVLQPGAKFGTSDIELQVEEPENLHSMLFFDNAGRESVGVLRLGLVERYNSLLGFRDPLTVSVYWAAGTSDYATSYEIPLNHHGTRLSANFDDSQINIVSGETQSYGVAGHSTTSALALSQPLVIRPRVQFTVTMSGDYITSLLKSQNEPLSNAIVRSLDWGGNLDVLDHRGVWSFSDNLTWGYYSLAGTRDFLKYDSSMVRLQNLWWGLTGMVRITGQDNSLNYLPTVEQFQIGGVATVRGYPEGRQVGDRGYAGTVELQIPSMFRRDRFLGLPLKQRLKEDIFFDTGAVYDSYRSTRPPGDDRYLTSVGGGFILSLSKYLSGHFDWGVPLRNTKGISPVGFDFYLQSSPPLEKFARSFAEGVYDTLKN